MTLPLEESRKGYLNFFVPGFRCAGGSAPYEQCNRGYFTNETGMQLGWQSLGVLSTL